MFNDSVSNDNNPDEEKKKYFKITANHAAQTLGEKYTKSNVRHERQVAKKRKVEQRAEKKRQAQTIQRSKLLAFPEYAGIGLGREVGSRPHAINRIQADEAFVSQLRFKNLLSSRHQVLSAHPMPSCDATLITELSPSRDAQTTSESSDIYTLSSVIGRDSQMVETRHCRRDSVALFSARVNSTSVWPPEDPHTLLACASGGPNNVQVGPIGTDQDFRPSVLLTIGDDETTTVWDSAIAPTGESGLIAASDRVRHISLDGRILSNLHKSSNSRAASWLNPTIIAASSGKRVLLWDTRAQGSSPRFQSAHNVTGILPVPSSAGTQLLVSTNHGLSLHDTRTSTSRASKPLLHFPFVHEGPQLVFDVNARGLVAFDATCRANVEVRVASLHTGREVRTLVPGPDGETLKMRARAHERPSMAVKSRVPPGVKRPTQLVWREDERGVESLQACLGYGVGVWGWDDLELTGEDE